MTKVTVGFLAALLGFASFSAGSAVAAAQVKVLHSFLGTWFGLLPRGNLVADSSGRFYGVTQGGGNEAYGTVFRLNRPTSSNPYWRLELLNDKFGRQEHSGYTNDSEPRAGVILGKDGLYGTAYEGGGLGGLVGEGTVFQLLRPASDSGPWAKKVLHRFTGGPDGGNPRGGVVFDGSDRLFGTTELGGVGWQITSAHTGSTDFPNGLTLPLRQLWSRN